MGDFYASCMDTASMDCAGLAPVESELRRINEIRTADEVGAEMTRMFGEGLPAPIEISSSPHTANPRRVVVSLSFRRCSACRAEYYTREGPRAAATLERYQDFMRTSFRMAGYPEAEVAAVFALESRLARASLSNAQRRDPQTIRYLSPDELRSIVPALDWSAHFASIRAPFAGEIMIAESALLREFGTQLQDTPVNVWKDYLAWAVLHSAESHLSEPFRNAYFSFYRDYLSGQREAQPRLQECVRLTDRSLGDALGRLYVAATFRPAVKTRMVEMIKNVRITLADTIRSVTDGASDEERGAGKADCPEGQTPTGYPDQWHIYSGEPMDGRRLANLRRAARYQKTEDARQIGKPADPDRWFMTAPTFNVILLPTSERHRHSGRSFGSADVQSRGRRCVQLWRNRCRDRPRNRPWIRRSGLAIRQSWREAGLVEARRWSPIP